MDSGSPDASAVDVAIIGAGFCGSMVAVNLLRQAKTHIGVALIERSGSFARGLAYGTTDRSHLLNVPAAKMGAFRDDHEHFYRWACENPEELQRAAPEVLELKFQLEKEGRLLCHRGRIFSISAEEDFLSVEFRDSNAYKDKALRVGYVVNCTGPECNYYKLTDPLVIQLFSRGIIVPDPLFLGLDVGLGGTMLNLQGERVTHLYTLGSPQKGSLFETTAVPELRVQAAELAGRILYQLEHRQNSHALDQSEHAAVAFQI